MDINPMKLSVLAKEVSDSFLSSGVALNDSLAKVSEENELTPAQIQRVAEIANHETNLALLKRSEDKTFTFPLADAVEVVRKIREVEPTKVAALGILSHVRSPMTGMKKTASEFKLPTTDPYVDACRIRNVDLLLNKLASRVVRYREELRGQVMNDHAEIAEEIGKIAALAKEHIILNHGTLSDFLKYACAYDPGCKELYQQVFLAMKEDLMKLGHPVDKALLNDKLEMPDSTLDVINGGHVLAIRLDTLKNKISNEDRNSKRIRLMDTFGEAIVDKMDSLKTSDDFSDYTLDTLDMLDKKAQEGLEEFVEFLSKNSGFLKNVGTGAKVGIGAGVIGGTLAGGALAQHVMRGAGRELKKPYDERARLEELTSAPPTRT